MKANELFIPNDVMFNIFKILPVRPLTRFQVVCKDWKNLIKDLIKTCIESHLHRNPIFLLEQYQHRYGGICLDEQDCDMGLGKVQKSPFNFAVVNSSNGLVCLKMVDNGIKSNLLLIWNPASRELREVRLRNIFHLELGPDFGTDFESQLIDHLGFGFCPLDNDYKIVRIHSFHSSNIKAVEVYSLNYGSWKEVDFGDDLNGIAMWDGNVTINGVMFWDIMGRDDENLILSFELSKEVCALIPMPYNIRFSPRCLIQYENKLGVVARLYFSNIPNLIHLWVMEKDTCKWTKIYTSSPCPCDFLYPETIWRNEIVLELINPTENDSQTIIFYLLNLATNKFKRLALH